MTYAEAKLDCATRDSTLFMVSDYTEATLVANWLDANANPKTESWYTAGISNDQLPGQFVWDGYGIDIGANYASLWLIDLGWYQDPANIWLLTGKKVVYAYDGQRWGFNISNSTDYRPFICQISKVIATQSIASQRDYTYGVSNPADYLLGPQFTLQPPMQLVYMKPFDASISNLPPVSFECQARGIPTPTYTWYRVAPVRSPAYIIALSYYIYTRILEFVIFSSVFSVHCSTVVHSGREHDGDQPASDRNGQLLAHERQADHQHECGRLHGRDGQLPVLGEQHSGHGAEQQNQPAARLYARLTAQNSSALHSTELL